MTAERSRLLVISRIAAAAAILLTQFSEPARPQSVTPQRAKPQQVAEPAFIPRPDHGSVTLPTEREQIEDLRQRLDARLDAIEKLLAKNTFSCKTPTVSVNNSGIEENCSPYLCRPIDGRCAIHSCANVNHCAPDFVCGVDDRCRAR